MPLTKYSILAAALVAIVLGSPAYAASGCAERPRVLVHVEGARPALAQRTLALVTAELTAHRARCEGSSDEGEPARILLRWLDDALVRIQVELRGDRAERDVDHGEIPMDGVPAALAIATDELLRSLYEEKQAASPLPEEPAEAPFELEVVRADPHRPSETGSHSFGLGFALETFPAHRSLLGPEARFGLALKPRLSFEAHLGLFALVPPFEASPTDRHHRLYRLGLRARHELMRPVESLTLSAVAGADAFLLLDASPAVLRPALRLGVRASLPAGPRMRFDAGLDALFLPFSLDHPASTEPIVGGFGLAPSVAWVGTF